MNDKTLNYKLNTQSNETTVIVSSGKADATGTTNRSHGNTATERKHLRLSSIFYPLSSVLLLGALAGGCTLRQAYPETQIRGYINGQPFSINAPKDSTLTGFDAVAETNGTIHVHIDSLQATLNATNLANAASGQAAIVTATGQVINQAVSQALQTATTAASKAIVP